MSENPMEVTLDNLSQQYSDCTNEIDSCNSELGSLIEQRSLLQKKIDDISQHIYLLTETSNLLKEQMKNAVLKNLSNSMNNMSDGELGNFLINLYDLTKDKQTINKDNIVCMKDEKYLVSNFGERDIVAVYFDDELILSKEEIDEIKKSKKTARLRLAYFRCIIKELEKREGKSSLTCREIVDLFCEIPQSNGLDYNFVIKSQDNTQIYASTDKELAEEFLMYTDSDGNSIYCGAPYGKKDYAIRAIQSGLSSSLKKNDNFLRDAYMEFEEV